MRIKFTTIVLSVFSFMPFVSNAQIENRNNEQISDTVRKHFENQTVPKEKKDLEEFIELLIERTSIPLVQNIFSYEKPDVPYHVTALPMEEFKRRLIQINNDLVETDPARSQDGMALAYKLLGLVDATKTTEQIVEEGFGFTKMVYLPEAVSHGNMSIEANTILVPIADWDFGNLAHVVTHEVVHYFQHRSPSLNNTPLMKASQSKDTSMTYDERLAIQTIVEGHAEWTTYALSHMDIENGSERSRIINKEIKDRESGFNDRLCSATVSEYLAMFPYEIGVSYLNQNATRVSDLYEKYPNSTEQILSSLSRMLDDLPTEIQENFWGDPISYKHSLWIGQAFLQYVLCKNGLKEFVRASQGWDGMRAWVTNDQLMVLWSVWDTNSDAMDVADQWNAAKSSNYKKIAYHGKNVLVILSEPQDSAKADELFEKLRPKLTD